jgi:hypothetical protein
VNGRFGLYEERDEFVGVFGQGWILGKEKNTRFGGSFGSVFITFWLRSLFCFWEIIIILA